MGWCPRCDHHSEAGGRFCSRCGTVLPFRRCESCGTANDLEALRCIECGDSLRTTTKPPATQGETESAPALESRESLGPMARLAELSALRGAMPQRVTPPVAPSAPSSSSGAVAAGAAFVASTPTSAPASQSVDLDIELPGQAAADLALPIGEPALASGAGEETHAAPPPAASGIPGGAARAGRFGKKFGPLAAGAAVGLALALVIGLSIPWWRSVTVPTEGAVRPGPSVADGPADRLTERPVGRPAERPAERAADRPADRAADRSTGRPVEGPAAARAPSDVPVPPKGETVPMRAPSTARPPQATMPPPAARPPERRAASDAAPARQGAGADAAADAALEAAERLLGPRAPPARKSP